MKPDYTMASKPLFCRRFVGQIVRPRFAVPRNFQATLRRSDLVSAMNGLREDNGVVSKHQLNV